MTEAQIEEVEAGPEALALLNGLTTAAPPEAYTPWDRLRDFRALFLGSPRGLRVLYQIMKHAGIMLSPVRRLEEGIDPYATFHAIGREDFGRWLSAVLTVEPRPAPERTVSEQTEE